MLVVMQAHATEQQVEAVCEAITNLGLRPHSLPGAQRTAIGITGNAGAIEPGALGRPAGRCRSHPGIETLQAGQPGDESREHHHHLSRLFGDHRRQNLGHDCRPVRHREPRAGLPSSPNTSPTAEPNSSAAGLSSRAPRPMPSRGSGKKDCASWPTCASASACAS